MKTIIHITPKTSCWFTALLVLVFSTATFSQASTIEERFATDTSLTPKSFASLFVNFTFRFHPELQSRELFLLTQEGDCDDYATLAYDVLRQHGYTTRLVLIQMPNSAHMVTYVEETKTYLDYNNRASHLGTTAKVNDGIDGVARKVAKDNHTTWVSYSIADFKNGKIVVNSRITNPDYVPAPTGTMGMLISAR